MTDEQLLDMLRTAARIVARHERRSGKPMAAARAGYNDRVLKPNLTSTMTKEELAEATFYAGALSLWGMVGDIIDLPAPEFERRMACIDHELETYRQGMLQKAGLSEQMAEVMGEEEPTRQ